MSESCQSTSTVMTAAPPPPLPTLAMPQLVGIAGQYPVDGGGGPAMNFQGMVQPFAATAAFGTLPAHGQILAIPQAAQLFSIYATMFGGDGVVTFAIPDLRGRAAVGGRPGTIEAQSLTMRYVIAATANADFPPVGTIGLFGGNYAPPGWLEANGATLPAAAYPQLLEVVGKTFGGDGVTTFELPDLTGCAAVGTGKGPGLPDVALGQSVPGTVPGLGVTYLIRTAGYYPVQDGNGGFPPSTAFIAQVTAYAGATAPSDWAVCDGSLLRIDQYEPLFSLVGTTYGGDGRETFGLPDLRGRMLVGN